MGGLTGERLDFAEGVEGFQLVVAEGEELKEFEELKLGGEGGDLVVVKVQFPHGLAPLQEWLRNRIQLVEREGDHNQRPGTKVALKGGVGELVVRQVEGLQGLEPGGPPSGQCCQRIVSAGN